MYLSKLLNLFKSSQRAPETISDPEEELRKLSSTITEVKDYEYVQTENQSDREHHKYLIHVTGLNGARSVIKNGRIFGIFTYATFAQDINQCTRQAEEKGCALIFHWEGSVMTGHRPATLKPDTAYHHVEPTGYVETFIVHGSSTPLKLIAIALSSDPEPYRVAHILESPISIMVQK